MSFTVSCIQLNCNDNFRQNFTEAAKLANQAAKNGADFIILPEHSDVMVKNKSDIFKYAEYMQQSRILKEYQGLAASINKWLLIGSIAVKLKNSLKLANRSFLIDNLGNIIAFYDKIHQFDVDLEEDATIYRESDNFRAGNKAKVIDLGWCNLGMTVCYDIRFPILYNKLALAGANCIAIPAAFTYITGKAHWQILARARAIETGCFIFASGQTGIHPAGNRTYGHSLIVDPWGRILAEAGEQTCFISASIDIDLCKKARKQLPNLRHGKRIVVEKQ